MLVFIKTLINVDVLHDSGPIVSLAIRGTYARSIWLDAIGPSDPALARRTDPNSLCAMYGGESRDECLLFCPRNPDRIHSELCRWFGGRVPSSGVIDIGTSSREFSGRKSKKANSRAEIPANCPVATLTALARSDIIVVISPLVPSKCLGLIFATCQRRGYQLHGVKRCRLSTRRATSLGRYRSSYAQHFPVSSKSCAISLICIENIYRNITSLLLIMYHDLILKMNRGKQFVIIIDLCSPQNDIQLLISCLLGLK